jgi:hypothetical protein
VPSARGSAGSCRAERGAPAVGAEAPSRASCVCVLNNSHHGGHPCGPARRTPLEACGQRDPLDTSCGEEKAPVRQRNSVIVHGNPLKLGLFGPNCASGRTYATLSERWDASWANNVTLAQLADAVGIECMVPIARWKGYGGESNPNGSSFESIAWACGLLAATRICTSMVSTRPRPVPGASRRRSGWRVSAVGTSRSGHP